MTTSPDYADLTMTDRRLRALIREERHRLFRKARLQRIEAKRFILSRI